MAEELVLSYVPGEGSAEGFYRGSGFEPTGEVLEGEVVMSLGVNDRSGRTAE
jgi:diamine N-acetyltransferase